MTRADRVAVVLDEEQVVLAASWAISSAGKGLPSAWAIMMARVRGPIAAATRSAVALHVPQVDVDEDRHEAVLQDRVDGRGEARRDVMTSSPARSPPFSRGEVSADSARRFAEEPEFVSTEWRTPRKVASPRWNRCPCGPSVSQKSSVASTAASTSRWSYTRAA